MDFYKRAVELKDETIKNRRYIHEHAETGLDIPVMRVNWRDSTHWLSAGELC